MSCERIGPKDEEERLAQEQGFEALLPYLSQASEIVICAHTSPDGDALGSQLALAQMVRTQWPHAHVTSLLADNDPAPHIYAFLPGFGELVRPEAYTGVPDLFVAVDLSSIERLNEARAICERSRHAIVIDHHPTNHPFGNATIVRPNAAAAGVIVAEFAQYLGIGITPAMAQNLLCAVITDTGRFQYQNSNGEAFKVASLLVDCGADPSEISLNVYQSFGLKFLHLKSLVLGRITTFEQGRIAYSYATASDFERTGANLDECDGLIDVVRSVEGSEVALFLKTVPGGKVRGNLRSKGAWDVSRVAKAVGGGGHKAAAGFTWEGDVDEALVAVLPLLKELLREEAQPSKGDGLS